MLQRIFGLEPGNLAQWIAAVATSIAVMIALFRETFLVWWRRPRLDAIIKLEPPDCHKIPMRTIVPIPVVGQVSAGCYYFRFWISNSGRSRAEQVQVFASELLRQLPDASFQTEKDFSPMNFRWSHSREIYAEGISVDMGKHCDLAHIIDPVQRHWFQNEEPHTPTKETVFSLDLEVQPNSLSHLIKPGTYRLVLLIGAANARPIKRQLEFTCTGKWFDDEKDMFRDGIRLKLGDA
jgi:hypothetical protein